jgi:hypothetical protein
MFGQAGSNQQQQQWRRTLWALHFHGPCPMGTLLANPDEKNDMRLLK